VSRCRLRRGQEVLTARDGVPSLEHAEIAEKIRATLKANS
jgi:hypothetical protein